MYQTDRLLLKVINSEYSLEVLDYYKRNTQFLKPWEVERKKLFYTRKFQEIQLNKDLLDRKNGKLLRLWIFKKPSLDKLNSSERLIGNIIFNDIRLGKTLTCNLGYKLDKDETNKGYITEALTKAIDVIFNDYKFNEISAHIMEGNKASLRVVEKLGFKNKGKAKGTFKIDGKWQEYINMVLVNQDMI